MVFLCSFLPLLLRTLEFRARSIFLFFPSLSTSSSLSIPLQKKNPSPTANSHFPPPPLRARVRHGRLAPPPPPAREQRGQRRPAAGQGALRGRGALRLGRRCAAPEDHRGAQGQHGPADRREAGYEREREREKSLRERVFRLFFRAAKERKKKKTREERCCFFPLTFSSF